ncbi:MAG: hypothetical protein NVS3B20_21900 [Polyangiales bacterium]
MTTSRTARCREGHLSDDIDYCSVCGAKIPSEGVRDNDGAAPGSPNIKGPSSAQLCPCCGEARADDARFCEVCRYDFVEGKPGPPPVGSGTPRPARSVEMATLAVPIYVGSTASTPQDTQAQRPPAVPESTARWALVITVDPSLDTEPDPSRVCPEGVAPITFALDRAEVLVGRTDDRRDIRPDLAVNDPGASRRHAKFALHEGVVSLQDLASTNGTRLNGIEVHPGSRTVLKSGDEVTFGRWTRMRLTTTVYDASKSKG